MYKKYLNQIGLLHGKKLELKMNLKILIHYQYQHLKVSYFIQAFPFCNIEIFLSCRVCEKNNKLYGNASL